MVCRYAWTSESIREGSEWIITHIFDKVVKIVFSAQDTTRPSDNPIPIWYKPRTLGWTSLKHIQNMPDDIHSNIGFTDPHAQTEQ